MKNIDNFKRKIKSIPSNLKGKFNTKEKLHNKIVALALAPLMLASGIGIGLGIRSHSKNDGEKTISIAQSVDSKDDSYEKKIPIKQDDSSIYTLDENEILFVEGTIKSGKNKVNYIDETGKLKTGTTDSKYIKELMQISKDQFEKYKNVYQVIPDVCCKLKKKSCNRR